jgi:hypothetical protein
MLAHLDFFVVSTAAFRVLKALVLQKSSALKFVVALSKETLQLFNAAMPTSV